jgi:hypothetical protein
LKPAVQTGTVRHAFFEEPAATGRPLDAQYDGRTRVKGLVVMGDDGSTELRLAQLEEITPLAPEDDLREEILEPFGEEETIEEPAPGDQEPLEPSAQDEEPVQEVPPLPQREFREIEPRDRDELPETEDRDLPRFEDLQLEEEDVLTPPQRTTEPTPLQPDEEEQDLDDFQMGLPRAMTPETERQQTEELCVKELQKLKASKISDVSLDIRLRGTAGEDFPFECTLDTGESIPPRLWSRVTYMWKASRLYHKPLYFEEVALERYGHTWGPCLQPFVSGAHFFGRLPVLPYCMGYTPPCECQYVLGHYRPGNCAPYMCPAVPLSLRGAITQAGAVVGTSAIVP